MTNIQLLNDKYILFVFVYTNDNSSINEGINMLSFCYIDVNAISIRKNRMTVTM